MISIEEALKIISENKLESRSEKISIEKACNKILAEDIFAPLPSPIFTNSAMDGFAVKWNDLEKRSDSKIELKIVGESRAGVPFKKRITDGEAVRISTGAMIPEGVDTVIPVEDLLIKDNNIIVESFKNKGQHVRYIGEEFKIGELLLKKFETITPPKIALLASMGIKEVEVFSSLKTAIITTGSELVKLDDELKEGQIYDSNTIMLSSAIESIGGEVKHCLSAKDSLEETKKIIDEVKDSVDIIIFSGGVSVGPHDHVKEASEQCGFKKLFWKVKQKPGKPFFFSRRNDTLLFGLPGNPVSALMCFTYYIMPLYRGFEHREISSKKITALCSESKKNGVSRDHFMRVKLEDSGYFSLLEKQGSNMLTTIAEADGFTLIKENYKLQKDELFEINLFPWS